MSDRSFFHDLVTQNSEALKQRYTEMADPVPSGGSFAPTAWLVPCTICGQLVDWCEPRPTPKRKYVIAGKITMCFTCQDERGITEFES